MIRRNIAYLILTVFFILFSAYAESETVMIIKGVVKDIETSRPISGASISNDLGFSTIVTDNTGKFSTVVVTSKPKIILTIHKEGYQSYTKTVDRRQKVNVEIPLKSIIKPQIIYGGFVKNSHIYGKVKELPKEFTKSYKVLVYVLTDKWYIHPYATNQDGMGYASIQKDGSWKINTIYRGYQAYKVALLLVRKEIFPPPTIALIKGDPEQELLSKIETEDSNFIEAPNGI